MCKALRVSILVHSNANTLDISSLSEEVLQTVLVGVEAEVADKQGGSLARGSTGLVATSSLSGELNPDLAAVKRGLIGGSKCLPSVGMGIVLDECLSLVPNDFTLGDGTIRVEVTANAILISVEGKSLHEQFSLAIMLVAHSCIRGGGRGIDGLALCRLLIITGRGIASAAARAVILGSLLLGGNFLRRVAIGTAAGAVLLSDGLLFRGRFGIGRVTVGTAARAAVLLGDLLLRGRLGIRARVGVGVTR